MKNDVSFNTGNSDIVFKNTVDGTTANSQNLTLTAGNGKVTFTGAVGSPNPLANLVVQANGNVTANSTINTQNLAVSSSGGNINFLGDATASNSGNGGSIALLSPVGTVNVKNLTTSGIIGGNITVVAKNSITAGQINSSGNVGNAGNVFLDPIGDVQVGFINAQGGTSGNGGTVFVSSTGGFFRATDSFPTLLSPTGFASISTAGGTGGGNITIQQAGGDGGPPIQPFVVGGATPNGTAAAITTGQSTIQSQSFPRSDNVGNIAIVTDGTTPTPSVTPTPTPVVTESPSVTPTPTPIATQPLELVSELTAIEPEQIQTPIAPVTTTSPTAAATPAPKPSTLDAEDSRRKIPQLDDPGGMANQVLTIDQTIISQLPPNYVKPQENPQSSSIVNSTSDRLLGYIPSPDRLFEQNNLEKTIWEIRDLSGAKSIYLFVQCFA